MSNTGWLASIQSLDEAHFLANCLPDILDMKQPSSGALGALPVEDVRLIVDWLDGRCLSSATIGDLPMQAEHINPALMRMADTGVDYVKLGLFGGEQQSSCLQQLQPVIQALNVPVIAVIFADLTSELDWVEQVSSVGFAGIMVDTANKTGRSLLDCWSVELLAEFVQRAKAKQLLCGLAGALRTEDIPQLATLQPDYLGFRSALCPDRERRNTLSVELAKNIHSSLKMVMGKAS